MIIMPAVDIRNGKCVRLIHGEKDKETVYSDNPVDMAKKWIDAGAERLHVIDLDGAFSGKPQNLKWVVDIKKSTNITIQLGGGLRSLDSIRSVLNEGIDHVILGSVILEEAGLAEQAFKEFQKRIMVALDVKGDNVAIHGWIDDSGFPLKEAIGVVERLGGTEIIFTDIDRDGTLGGANIKRVEQVMKDTSLKVYASGGVTTIEDIKKLKSIGSPGCIVGKALYEGKIDLKEALRVAQS
jgi:phosphoribosylformimino-5-aminoimidazole carboxamide ribotide isomerase